VEGDTLITISSKGSFSNTEKFLKRSIISNYNSIFEKYGKEGVRLLSSATPVDTGKTSESWTYEVKKSKSGISIEWSNSNVVNGVPIAIIIQYGHATQNGAYIQGQDYINPVIKPLFDKLTDNLWKDVSKV
jgi:hypothetical protein